MRRREPDGAGRAPPLVVAVVLFDEFELLDVAAPCELLGASAQHFRLVFAADASAPVSSSCLGITTGQAGPSFVPTPARPRPDATFAAR